MPEIAGKRSVIGSCVCDRSDVIASLKDQYHLSEELDQRGIFRPCDPLSLDRSNPVEHDLRDGWNNLAVVGVVGGEGYQHKLRAVRQFDISRIVARRAGPSGLRPKPGAGHSLQSDTGKAVALIVVVFRGAAEIALQQLHHLRTVRL